MLRVIPLLDKEGPGVVDRLDLSRTSPPPNPSSAEEGSYFQGSEFVKVRRNQRQE
jgi:hypothetical protein